MTMPLQKIYFGPPGSGKSHKAFEEAKSTVRKTDEAEARKWIITTVFHPETTYGDFTAKLLPVSNDNGSVGYEVHAGPFVQALALALINPDQPVVLIIDEINRGPCAAIFGDLFQLLDRGVHGHSQYEINIPKLLVQALKLQGIQGKVENKGKPPEALSSTETGKLRLPANLHLLGTMNTSDESVYAMDSAFKRRWQWEFVKWNDGMPDEAKRPRIRREINQTSARWDELLAKLNYWISKNAYGSSVDDKLIGYRFLKLKFIGDASKYGAQTITELSVSPKDISSRRYDSIWHKLYQKCKQFPEGIPINQALKEDIDFTLTYDTGKCPVDADWRETAPKGGCFEKSIRTKGGRGSEFTTQGIYESAKKLIEQLNQAAEAHIKQIEESERENYELVQQLLPHHLWDNVFSRDRSPIERLIRKSKQRLRVQTYGEFLDHWDTFLEQIMKGPDAWESASEGQ